MSDGSLDTNNSTIFGKGFFIWLLTTFVPLSTLILVMAGYGVTLAVEEMFGIPANHIAASTSDYLQLSSMATVMWFNKILAQLLQTDALWNFYASQWMIMVAVLIMCVGFWFRRELKKWLLQLVGFVCRGSRASVDLTVKNERKFVLVVMVMTLISPALFYFLTALFISVIFLSYSLIPAASVIQTRAFIQTNIIDPKSCAPLRNLYQRQSPSKVGESQTNHAMCIALVKEGKKFAAGRTVVSTSSRIVLLDPKTGKSRLFSLDGMTVESVEQL